MALIKCKECGKKISDIASACLNCGCPIDNDIKDNKEKKTKIIYNKFNIPKALKIILPIIFVFLALCIFPNDSSTIPKSNLETSAVCRKNISHGMATGSETIFLNGNNKKTSIEKKLSVDALNMGNGTELGEISIKGLCSEETKNANEYSNVFVDCSAGDGDDINIQYTNKKDIDSIVNEYINNDYQCITYSANKKEIVGNWCLEFDNDGNKHIYHYTFDSNGYYTSKQVFGENGKYVDESEGYYSFDGQKINEISFVKGYNFYGSAYNDYFTYNKDNDTLINSNIRSEFPNVFTRCD